MLHVYRGDEITPHGALTKNEDDPATFDVMPLTAPTRLDKYSFTKRWIQQIQYGGLYAREIARFRPAVVISANTPLESQYRAQRYCRANGIAFVHWWTDFTGFTANAILTEKFGLLGAVPSRYFIALERYLVRNSDHVIITTEDHFDQCDDWGMDRAKVSVVHNWAPISEYPSRPRDNRWAREHGTVDRFCFMWTGTMGFKHNPELLLELAIRHRDDPSVKVLVVSESIGARWLKEKADEMNLAGLEVIDFQPYEDVPDMMAAADVLVASVNNEVSFYAVPSKVLSYMCAGRPIALAIDGGNLAARIVTEHEMGFVCDPDDVTGFVDAASRLRADPSLCARMGENGRNYAMKHFDVVSIADDFETIVDRARS